MGDRTWAGRPSSGQGEQHRRIGAPWAQGFLGGRVKPPWYGCRGNGRDAEGRGVYGLGMYLVALQALHGWSASLIASAMTVYYLLSTILVIFIGDAFERFGPRRLVLLGIAAMEAGVAGLTLITKPWQLYVAFLLMAGGWATMSGAAINIIIAPWFERRRGLATSLAPSRCPENTRC